MVLKPNVDLQGMIQKLKEKNILTVAFGPQMLRMVTHLDISHQMVGKVCEELKKMKNV
jgi:acetylornithine/succinyldiaminopimelate/putrescine aminotransferase